jgi:hypothetical protein
MLRRNQLLILLLLTLFPIGLQAQAWMIGFNYRKKLTFDKSKVTANAFGEFPSTITYTDQLDFPVFIEIVNKDLIFKDGSCGSKIQDQEGRDISFALNTAPTIALNFQIEKYDAETGTIQCWVKISRLAANLTITPATEIYFYYGGTVLHNPTSLTALRTWNSNYSKVWHMNATYPQTGIHQLSTNPTSHNSLFVDGMLGKSAAFDGISTSYVGENELNPIVTISAWIKFNALGKEQMIVSNDSAKMGGFQMRVNTEGKLVIQTFNGLSPPIISTGTITMGETGRWYHIWAAILRQNVTFYIDNNIAFSSAASNLRLGPGGSISIGASKQNTLYFNGEIDELNIQNALISKQWMATSYTNQRNPKSFFSIGPEEDNTLGYSRFIGTTSQWNLPSNWSGNILPAQNSNVLIAAGRKVLSAGNFIFNKLIVESGSTLEIGSDLTFKCLVDISPTGTVKINDGGKLRVESNFINDGLLTSGGLSSTLCFEGKGLRQEYSGIGSANISVLENNQFNSTSQLSLISAVDVTSTVSLKKGIIQSYQTLVFRANSSSSTPSLLPVDSEVASIIGDVIVEQYISGDYPNPATARGWRLLSSPVLNSNLSENKSYDSRSFQQQIFVTGSGGSTNGFDASPLNGATIYTHDQSLAGTLSQKYIGIKSTNQKIDIGKGVYVFSRGSRYAPNAFANQIQTPPFINPQPYVIRHIGKLFVGDLDINLFNKDTNSPGDGFNLLGNPYAANLRWGAVHTERTTGFIWQFDPLNAGYIVDNSPDVNIPYGTGFFVRVSKGEQSGKLSFSEHSKSTTTNLVLPVLQAMRSNLKNQTSTADFRLKITIKKEQFEQPYVLNLTENGFEGLNDQDALKIGEGHVSISSRVDQELVSIDSRPITEKATIVDLIVTGTVAGSYELLFHPSADNTFKTTLVDTFTNVEKQIKPADNSYIFSMDKKLPGSTGDHRFKVLIEKADEVSVLQKNIKVYPNPFSERISIQLNDNYQENINLLITDLLGKTISSSLVRTGTGNFTIDTQAFSQGYYLLQIKSATTNKLLTTVKLIKI